MCFLQIKLMKCGGGCCYYCLEDVDFFKGICYLFYDYGYMIKGVQKFLKLNGNKFVIVIGNGDMDVVEVLLQVVVVEQVVVKIQLLFFEEDQIVGKVKLLLMCCFFGFGVVNQDFEMGFVGVGKEDCVLLQEVFYDLLECKCLFDQVC